MQHWSDAYNNYISNYDPVMNMQYIILKYDVLQKEDCNFWYSTHILILLKLILNARLLTCISAPSYCSECFFHHWQILVNTLTSFPPSTNLFYPFQNFNLSCTVFFTDLQCTICNHKLWNDFSEHHFTSSISYWPSFEPRGSSLCLYCEPLLPSGAKHLSALFAK